jgi:hypothetical protein
MRRVNKGCTILFALVLSSLLFGFVLFVPQNEDVLKSRQPLDCFYVYNVFI